MAEVTITKTITKTIEVPDMSDAVKASLEYIAPLKRHTEEATKLAEASKNNVAEQMIVWLNEFIKPYWDEERGVFVHTGNYQYCTDQLYIRYPHHGNYSRLTIYFEYGKLRPRSENVIRNQRTEGIADLARGWADTKKYLASEVNNMMRSKEYSAEEQDKKASEVLSVIENFEV